ncbi:NAD(P)/FAD-dependent oxidoreductase [Pyrobaculum aerophilum]|uniref:Proline dehydrogenase n=2 Tax=Pyrobaculum aerophilum TaxID=13773 RepID=Q8ZVF5_PYRAE|nr:MULTISPECIES: FAD-binding oxidoreductase [Pyrobaculum]AAL64101.1 proline dehydrogenase [Pyrobaculum aerophilum str. IM2]MCX8135850.1 FAD-binding oxidoreductase [Pyrobaculum aerophilum]HII47135.1 FAD-binding oxidoreductase [Pyrobaculum aerophilum]
MYDYVIVGAGIVGMAAAYHIRRLSPHSKVLVVDQNPGVGMGDTGRSAAAFRTAFTSWINRVLAKTSIDFYREVQRKGVDLGMRFVGYLFLVPEENAETMRKVAEELRTMGIAVEFYRKLDAPVRFRVSEDEEAREMGLPDVAFGLLVKEAGIMDPEKLVRYYYEEYTRLGGEVKFNTRVENIFFAPKRPLGIPGEPFVWQDVKVAGVETTNGVIEARNVILATGAWTERLMDALGFGLPLKPRKRQVFVVRADGELRRLLELGLADREYGPMFILPKGVYMRPEPGEGTFWVGVADRRPFRLEEPPEAEEALWRYGIYPVLTKYVPAVEGRVPQNAWAGHYDENVVDYQPIVDRLAEGLYVAAGTSGSGIMKADAIGRIAAYLALGYGKAELYGGVVVESNLLRHNRCFEEERLVI